MGPVVVVSTITQSSGWYQKLHGRNTPQVPSCHTVDKPKWHQAARRQQYSYDPCWVANLPTMVEILLSCCRVLFKMSEANRVIHTDDPTECQLIWACETYASVISTMFMSDVLLTTTLQIYPGLSQATSYARLHILWTYYKTSRQCNLRRARRKGLIGSDDIVRFKPKVLTEYSNSKLLR